MNNEHGLTAENIMRNLPSVLQNDEKTQVLAAAVAEVLSSRVAEIDALRIYTRIDELPEGLLDILAYDFKVDWYGYDYPVTAKRALIKDSFRVHRILGTRGAVEKALSDIYPGSEVEEWFEYDGEPYFFRVILDMTEQRVDITHSEIVRTVNIYKSLRSHLEDDAISYRSRFRVGIAATAEWVAYATRTCGTWPDRATQGGITLDDINIDANSGGQAYTAPRSGMMDTGCYPAVATQGGVETGGIDVGANGGGLPYSARFCGTIPGVIS